MALRIWGETSGACFLEMATGGQGEFADHLRDGDSAALPGWHTISSGVLSYGRDPDGNQVLQRALLDHEVLRTLAAQIRPALDRPQLNGIKVFVCRTPDSITTEVRINGEPAEEASAAMAALSWPALTETAMARFYAVAVHPD